MAKRNAQGNGTIYKRSDGRWEAKYIAGVDHGTGKAIRKSIYGKTQREVREKLTEILAAINTGTYMEPNKMPLSEWLTIWLDEYVSNSVKPYTLASYKVQCNNHIIPSLGAVPLQALNTHSIQTFYNTLLKGKGTKKPLSPKTIKNIHGCLHKSLEVATKLGYIRFNPASACELPRMDKKEIKPLDEAQISAFIGALENEPYKNLFLVTLFTGMRQGEVLGLQWSCVDFAKGTILIDKQLAKEKKKDAKYYLASTKSGESRIIRPAASVMAMLRNERIKQTENRLRAGQLWNNENDLVFTNECGKHLAIHTVYKHYKKIVASIGAPDSRFHDLRHSYATMALKSGDSVKDVQTALGHSTSVITLDLYSHVTTEMQKASADRMERFIQSVK